MFIGIYANTLIGMKTNMQCWEKMTGAFKQPSLLVHFLNAY